MTPKERIAELRRELAAHPTSRQFYQLGELLRREGELAQAAQVLRQGLSHHPRYVAAWVSLGRALLDLHDLAGAHEAFRHALELDPQNPVAWRLLAETLLALGERSQALAAFQQALALVPGDEVLEAAVASLKAELAVPSLATAPPLPAGEEPSQLFAQASPPPLAEPFQELAVPPPPPPAEIFDAEVLAVPPPAIESALAEPFGSSPLSEEPPTTAPAAATPASQPEPPPLPWEEVAGGVLGPPPAVPGELFPPVEGVESQAGASELAHGPLVPPAEAGRVPLETSPAVGVPEELPSLAAARAAIHRGQLREAEAVLHALLTHEPENQEAADLLALVKDMMEPLPPEEPRLSPRTRKIAALQRYLANLTRARQRRGL